MYFLDISDVVLTFARATVLVILKYASHNLSQAASNMNASVIKQLRYVPETGKTVIPPLLLGIQTVAL
jgi:hypothetical protein